MPNKTTWRRTLLGTGALVAIALAVWLASDAGTPPETARRSDLELREGVLYRRGASRPFAGLLIEEWRPGQRKVEVEIFAGRPHGRSQGFFENGQREVLESFVRGVSHGTRTRWYPDGARKSEATIRDGAMVGVFREWHPNGRLARETPLKDGVAHGEVRAWDALGNPAGSARVERGTLVRRD